MQVTKLTIIEFVETFKEHHVNSDKTCRFNL